MPLEISAKRDGFRRCGIAHTTEPKVYPDDQFTDEQLQTLFDEPLLDVKVVDADIVKSENLPDGIYAYSDVGGWFGPFTRIKVIKKGIELQIPEGQRIDDQFFGVDTKGNLHGPFTDDMPETDLYKSDANLAEPNTHQESDRQKDQAQADTEVSDTAWETEGESLKNKKNTENQAEDKGPTQTPVTDGEPNAASVNTDPADAGTDAAETAAAKPEPAQVDKPARASRKKK